jgi:hypothetical protein
VAKSDVIGADEIRSLQRDEERSFGRPWADALSTTNRVLATACGLLRCASCQITLSRIVDLRPKAEAPATR